MNTLLLSCTCQPEADQLVTIAKEANWHHQWIDRPAVPPKLIGDDFGLYAETDVALAISQRHQLALIEPTFDLLSRLPKALTLREVAFMSLGDAQKLQDRVFVKPADCTNKAFDAGVCEAGKYIRCSSNIASETPVLVSEPVQWDVEYRVIVLERQVITFSPYIRGGWLARDQNDQWPYPEEEATEVLSICGKLLDDISIPLPPAFTLDVGRIENQGWAVIEFNPVWCSGLLGCDLSKMLPVFRRVCLHRDELTSADSNWIIDRVNRVKTKR